MSSSCNMPQSNLFPLRSNETNQLEGLATFAYMVGICTVICWRNTSVSRNAAGSERNSLCKTYNEYLYIFMFVCLSDRIVPIPGKNMLTRLISRLMIRTPSRLSCRSIRKAFRSRMTTIEGEEIQSLAHQKICKGFVCVKVRVVHFPREPVVREL